MVRQAFSLVMLYISTSTPIGLLLSFLQSGFLVLSFIICTPSFRFFARVFFPFVVTYSLSKAHIIKLILSHNLHKYHAG
jgi:hypothetical protein